VHIASSIEVAQAAKLVENAQREMNIAFANQVADWSYTQGLDVHQILAAANTHPRVDVLRPGVGAGGSCLPLATSMLIELGHAKQMSLLRTTATYHRQLASQLVERILTAAFDGEPLIVAILGASYKPNVADTRDSPTFAIKQALEQDSRVASVRVTDAMAKTCTWATLMPMKHAIEGAHALVCCVAHADYAQLSASILDAMETTVIADFCAGLPPSWSRDVRGLWLRR
jgi:UDP-N-acetyl-D-mannosaminuronic acid dehydrogenase